MVNQNDLIKLLRKKRAEMKLTQSQTAHLIGISRQQLSKIDKGKVRLLHVKTSDAILKFIGETK